MPPERGIYEVRATGVKLSALNGPIVIDLIADHPRRSVSGYRSAFYANAVLFKRIKVIWAVQSPSQKYSDSFQTQITCMSLTVSSHRGAARDRHGRGARCDGRGCADNERR